MKRPPQSCTIISALWKNKLFSGQVGLSRLLVGSVVENKFSSGMKEVLRVPQRMGNHSLETVAVVHIQTSAPPRGGLDNILINLEMVS